MDAEPDAALGSPMRFAWAVVVRAATVSQTIDITQEVFLRYFALHEFTGASLSPSGLTQGASALPAFHRDARKFGTSFEGQIRKHRTFTETALAKKFNRRWNANR
jgi:hypothetical protein